MSTDQTTGDPRLILATNAVRDECGSRLCNWTDRGTERECWAYSGRECVCRAVAKAVLEAIDND